MLIDAPKPSPAYLIRPGHGIGHVRLGEAQETVIKVLGRPTTGDAALGHYWQTWEGRHAILSVYSSVTADGPALVREIRVTSSSFRTDDGLGVNTPRQTILRRYPDAALVARIAGRVGEPNATVYDAKAEGISFEFSLNRCHAVTIHTAGQPVLAEYTPVTDYIYGRGSAKAKKPR